ncbi:hypothetical protein ACFQ60_17755 [Streptomyces zhihengii]|uniref:Uncharacterized protein n=1 Tax=Streptomyces zhihengii TaxID=1818004 RepID=A0ABS2UW75_9ACTN|nr:hypothetical protein [Streptomyces zhihengii]MBM9621811.1 hypothetical protein [Streptomyces zhihengii]
MATLESTPPPTVFAWCHWHKGPSGTAVLIRIIEQGSGPGAALYACAPCREQRGLVPVDEQPDAVAYRAYVVHTQVCTDCTDTGRCDGGAQLWKAYRAALAVPVF